MKEKKGFLDNQAVQSILSALICIVLGILIGFIVLLIINPSEALNGMTSIWKDLYEVLRKYIGQNSTIDHVCFECLLLLQSRLV